LPVQMNRSQGEDHERSNTGQSPEGGPFNHRRRDSQHVVLLVGVLPLATIGIYQYLKVVLGPTYDAEKMSLNYEVLGSGPKQLLLIHGLTGSLNYWKQDIESISNTHTILLIDLLGFGGSPKPNSNYSLDTQLQAIEKVIIKTGFGDQQSLVVGHSMGAT